MAILSVTCTFEATVLNVAVLWEAGNQDDNLTILNAADQPVAGNVVSGGRGFANWQPANGAMTAGQLYTAQVTAQQVPSNKVPLLWAAPTNFVSAFDGETALLSWTAPTGLPTPGSYEITISYGTVVQSVTAFTTAIEFIPALTLERGKNWSVTITPTLAVSTGPTLSGSIVSAAVAVASVVCSATSNTAGQLEILPIPPTSTSFETYSAILTKNGNFIAAQSLPYTSGTPMLFALPANSAASWPLSGDGYAIALRPLFGTATGPIGTGLPVVVNAPIINAANVNALADGTSASVAMSIALPISLPPPTGFIATVTNGGTPVGSANFNGSTGVLTITATLVPANTYVLTVRAQVGTTSSGPLAQVNLLTAMSTMSSIDNDAGIVSIGFGAAAGVAYTQVDIKVGGVITATGISTTSPLQLPAPSTPFSVYVRGFATGLLGPAAGPVAALSQAPIAQGVKYNLSNAATFTWAALPTAANVGGYSVETYDGATLIDTGTVTGGATNTAPLTVANLHTGGNYTARVRATRTDTATTATLSGPRSNAVPVLSNAPSAIRASYDGTTAIIAWDAPSGNLGQGYLLTLTDSANAGNPTTLRLATNKAQLAYATTAASVVTIAVQATGGDALGPATTAPLFTPALFPSSNNQNAAYIAPSASLNFSAQPLAIYLPALLTNPTATLPSNATFSLSTTAIAPWAYLLTVSTSGSVWSFDASAIRAPVLTAITDFMTQMIAQGLTPQGDFLLRQVFARILPMTFVETLFYAYNFNIADGGAGNGQGVVDLTPGLALHVEVESYESLPTSAQSGNAGVVGNAVFDFDINSYRAAGTWRQGFEAFISRLVGHGVIFPAPDGGQSNPLQTGAGGVPDFYYPMFLQPYYRLIYPPTFLKSTDVGLSQNLRDNVTLIAAATRADLEAATTTLRNSSGSYQAVNAMYFRGRAMISPRIHVFFNDNDMLVPLGTTVANLLERYATLNAAGGRAGQLRFTRGLVGVAIVGWAATRSMAVRIDWAGGCTWGDGTSWLDVPLLHGDRIDLDLG